MLTRLDTDCEVILFFSSSGRCNLDCHYCIIDPIPKHEPSLDYGDIRYMLERFPEKAFLVFSGKGDFFSGYRRSEGLLSAVLDHEVEVALDINGSLLHEMPELPEHKLEKIRYVNLTLHYLSLKRKDLLAAWTENARWLIARKGEVMLLGYVVSPLVAAEWEEGLAFYERAVFEPTGKKVLLIRDVNRPLNAAGEEHLAAVTARYGHLVEGTYREDFAARFAHLGAVWCPAGHRYFRVWNDGAVQGCTYAPELARCGNLKERKLLVREEPFRCSMPAFCDCHIVAGLGKMAPVRPPGDAIPEDAAKGSLPPGPRPSRKESP